MLKKLTAILFILFIAASCSSRPVKSDKNAKELMDAVLGAVEFPPTVVIDDEKRIADMGIDVSLCEEYSIVGQMLSVDLVEVIIIKAKDGVGEKLKAALEKRKEGLIKDFAFYPNQLKSAEATTVGSVKNVYYLICHAEASKSEEKLLQTA